MLIDPSTQYPAFLLPASLAISSSCSRTQQLLSMLYYSIQRASALAQLNTEETAKPIDS